MGLDMFLTSADTENPQELMYWREANAIHAWFIKNVQGGEDNCKEHPVTLQQLCDLVQACETVYLCRVVWKDLNEVKDEDTQAFLSNYRVIRGGEDISCTEFLPTQEGFFFGGTEYDHWYYQSVLRTYICLSKVLQDTCSTGDKFSNDVVAFYQSSW